MKKIMFSLVILFTFATAQMPDPELYAIVTDIQMSLKSNGQFRHVRRCTVKALSTWARAVRHVQAL